MTQPKLTQPRTTEQERSVNVLPGDRYVAMGSSFGAGPGIGRRAAGSPRKAGRSSINYAHLVASRLGLALDDETFSGATAAEMLDSGVPGTPSQLDAVTAGTRLVTITAGGNDVGYLPGLVWASLPVFTRIAPPVRRRVADTQSRDRLDERFARLQHTMTLLVQAIRLRSPSCLIVLVDYLTVLPADESVTTRPLPTQTAAWGRDAAARLAAVTKAVAQSESCLYAAASEMSQDHDAWSPIPWTKRFHYSLRGGAPYHPNAAGMAAVADLVISVVGQRP